MTIPPKYFRSYINYRDKLIGMLRLIILPGFGKVPLYDVMVFFIKGLFKGALSNRAAAVAFNFFLAIFPFILFIFTLIPYIPIENFQTALLGLFKEIIPQNTFEAVETTIFDIVMRQNSGLLSLSFILTFVFSTNGINAIIEGFNSTWHDIETKNWVQQRLIAVFLMVILSVLVILSIAFLTLGGIAIEWLQMNEWVTSGYTYTLLRIMQWLITVSLTFLSVSFLYYYAPAQRRKYSFFSPGSMLATILLILGTLSFNYYIANFSRYNALYGSIGTLIIFLLWLYFNALILLIGFELNASIKQASDVSVTDAPSHGHHGHTH
ncbi:MAG: YihY/virulence factor BrkB family protein [Bacteroidetes bacterium]|nr:YihY/virulence factor BrkB family protein [Bacteroidota bacterium]